VHLASLGYRLQPEFSSRSRSRCSEGGFGLWLGDEGIVVVKRAHNPLYSNIALGFLLYFWEMSVALPLLPFWYVGLYSAFDLFFSLVDIKIVSFHFNS
jgi:hypothetical protein